MKQHVGAVWLAGTTALAFAGPAWGQVSATPSPAAQGEIAPTGSAPDQLADDSAPPDIIVTAQKFRQRLIDVPQSISVISKESLENQHARKLTDYLTRIPSANIVESQAGQARVVLRGINAGGVGATVATYIDETPFGSATSLANGGVLAPDIDPFDLDRVEVLRGPQGTLYGANSLGGLVKYVTAAPDPTRVSAGGELGLENVAHGDTAGWGRVSANMPLSDTIAFRASGFYRTDPGYIDDPFLGRDVNDAKTYGGRFSFLARATPALRIRASVMLQNIRSDGTNTVDVNPVTLKSTYGRLAHLRVIDEPNDIDYRLYNTTIDYDFGPVTLVSSTSYGTLDQAQVFDGTGVYGPLLSFIFETPLGGAIEQGMEQRRFTQELRLASSHSNNIEWTVGAYYTREKNRLTQNLFGVDAITGDRVADLDGLILVDLPSRYREIAGFGNAVWHIAPKFDLTAGARYSHNRQSVEQNTDGLLAGGASTFAGSSSDNVFTYNVAPTFMPNDNTRIYARVARGYRPGGPNAVSPLAPAGVPRQFGPDTTTNYEIGVKTQSSDRVLSLEVTAFLIDWKDIQLLAQVEGFGVNTNGGSARSKGVEFTVGVNPTRSLSIFANGSYVDADLTSDAPGLVGGLDGDPLPYSPKWQSTIGAEYTQPLSASLTGRAGLSWHYTGVRHSDFDPGFGQTRLKAFSQIDAHAGVDFKQFRLDAFVRNLTDARGIVNLATFGAAQNGDFSVAVIRPRTIGISLGMRY